MRGGVASFISVSVKEASGNRMSGKWIFKPSSVEFRVVVQLERGEAVDFGDANEHNDWSSRFGVCLMVRHCLCLCFFLLFSLPSLSQSFDMKCLIDW